MNIDDVSKLQFELTQRNQEQKARHDQRNKTKHVRIKAMRDSNDGGQQKKKQEK